MNKEKQRCSDKLESMIRCPFFNSGWCYSDHVNESGCISLDECRKKNRKQWLAYLAVNKI